MIRTPVLELSENKEFARKKHLEIRKMLSNFAALKTSKNKLKLTFILIYCKEIGTY